MTATTNTYSTYVGCFQYFAQSWQGIVPMRVVKDEVHQDQAGSLVPKWFSGAQAPTIQFNAKLVLQPATMLVLQAGA